MGIKLSKRRPVKEPDVMKTHVLTSSQEESRLSKPIARQISHTLFYLISVGAGTVAWRLS